MYEDLIFYLCNGRLKDLNAIDYDMIFIPVFHMDIINLELTSLRVVQTHFIYIDYVKSQ